MSIYCSVFVFFVQSMENQVWILMLENTWNQCHVRMQRCIMLTVCVLLLYFSIKPIKQISKHFNWSLDNFTFKGIYPPPPSHFPFKKDIPTHKKVYRGQAWFYQFLTQNLVRKNQQFLFVLQWEKYDFLFYITDFPPWGFGVDDKNVKLPFILFNPSLIVFSEEESVLLWSSLKYAAINIILFKMMHGSSWN